MNPKHSVAGGKKGFAPALAAFIAITAIYLAVSPAAGIAKNVSKLLFEGNSFGKTVAFLAFEIILLAILAIAVRLKWVPKKKPAFYLKAFLAATALLLLIGYGSEAWLFSQSGAGIGSAIGTIYSENGFTSWEATYLQHNHANKIAATEFLSLFGMQKSQSVDTGLPIFNILPFGKPLSIAILAIAAMLLVCGMLFTLGRFRKPDRWFWLWNIAFFAGFTLSIDGGIFSIVGINFIGLITIFLMHEFAGGKTLHNYLDSGFARFVGIPFLAMLGTALILQGIAGTPFWENHGAVILLAGIAMLAFNSGKRKIAWGTIGAIAVIVLLFPLISGIASGNLLQGNGEKIYVYPSPYSTADEWNSALGGAISVASAENYGNFAVLNAGAKGAITMDEFKAMVSAKAPEHYYDAETGGRESNYEFSVSNENAGAFADLNSGSFKIVSVKRGSGNAEITVRTRASRLMALLFALNYVQEKSGKKQVTIAMKRV